MRNAADLPTEASGSMLPRVLDGIGRAASAIVYVFVGSVIGLYVSFFVFSKGIGIACGGVERDSAGNPILVAVDWSPEPQPKFYSRTWVEWRSRTGFIIGALASPLLSYAVWRRVRNRRLKKEIAATQRRFERWRRPNAEVQMRLPFEAGPSGPDVHGRA
jgi:hypothetical protein